MARDCDVCGKRRNIAMRRVKLRGKYNPTVKRMQRPNLQNFTMDDGKKVTACSRCRKTLTKKMAA